MITESLCYGIVWVGRDFGVVLPHSSPTTFTRSGCSESHACTVVPGLPCNGRSPKPPNLRCVFWDSVSLHHCCSGLCQQKRAGRDNNIYPRYPATVPCWLEQKPVLKNKTTFPSCKMFPVSFGRCQGRLAPDAEIPSLLKRCGAVCSGGDVSCQASLGATQSQGVTWFDLVDSSWFLSACTT